MYICIYIINAGVPCEVRLPRACGARTRTCAPEPARTHAHTPSTHTHTHKKTHRHTRGAHLVHDALAAAVDVLCLPVSLSLCLSVALSLCRSGSVFLSGVGTHLVHDARAAELRQAVSCDSRSRQRGAFRGWHSLRS